MKNLIKFGVAIVISLTVVFSVKAGFGNGYTGSPAPVVWTGSLTNNAPGTGSTNVNFSTCVISNNVEVVEIDVITPVVTGCLVNFFDTQSNGAPMFGLSNTVAGYVSRIGSNILYATSFIGYNGVTNYYTNQGFWTYNVTNAAATNALPAQGAMLAINGVVNQYKGSILVSQGFSIQVSTNATIVVYYIPNK